jgi:hypothetical protein
MERYQKGGPESIKRRFHDYNGRAGGATLMSALLKTGLWFSRNMS